MFKLGSRNPKRKHMKFEVLLLAKQVYYGLELRIWGLSQVGEVENMGKLRKKTSSRYTPKTQEAFFWASCTVYGLGFSPVYRG